jgi:outer membrane receptor protein involved in Fe transport
MKRKLLMGFFGGWLFACPPLVLSNSSIDSSILVARPVVETMKQVVVLGDSLRAEKLAEVRVEATLLRATAWERQPYRTDIKKIGAAAGSETRTTPELLMHQTGVMVQKTNHGGGSPTLRGLQGNQTLMLVDGIRLNNSIFRYGPNQYLNTVDAFGLDQMEVLFGNGAVQYGSDAMGGVILAKFHEPETKNLNRWVPHFFVRGMSGQQERSARGSIDYATAKFGLTLGGTLRNFGNIVAGGDQVQLTPTGYTERNFDGKFQVYGKRGKWTFAHQNHNQFDVPIYHKVSLENHAFYNMDLQLRSMTYLKKEWANLMGALDKVEVVIGQQGQGEWRSFQKNGSSISRREKDSVDTRFVTLKVFGKQKKGFQYVMGIDAYVDRVFSERADWNLVTSTQKDLRALYPNDATNNQTSAFLYATQSWKSGLLRAGLRYSGTQVRIPTVELGEVVDNNEAVVFDVAASRKLSESLFVYSNVGSSFRSPNVDDLGTLGIVDFRFELPQYGLEPEYSLNKELGFKWKSDRAMATVCAYHNQLSGLITRVNSPKDSLQGYPVYSKQNVGEAEIWGAECDFQWALNKKMQIKGGAFFAVGENISDNEPMRRIPPAMFNATWMFQYNVNWKFVATVYGAKAQNRLAKADIQDNRIGAAGTTGYVTGDLRCRYQRRGVYVDFALTNLGNQRYKTHGSGVFMPGRAFQLLVGF